jgi:hypothetical protein
VFVIDGTNEGDNQGRGCFVGMAFCWDEQAGVLAEAQGGVCGFDFRSDSREVGIGGVIVQEEFSPVFVNSGFDWLVAFCGIANDLQVRYICSCLGGGVSSKH